nr:immunoglobulin heavy chain junction region [Mus musculus]
CARSYYYGGGFAYW